MKTMIEVNVDSTRAVKSWIALNSIQEVREFKGYCWIICELSRYYYPGTMEGLANRIRQSELEDGQMRLIGLEDET